MLSQAASSSSTGDGESKEPEASSSSDYLSLTDALRISISGEDMDLPSEEELMSAASSSEPAAGSGRRSGRTLLVPDSMPVDLRVKLALAMINLGQEIPEV